MMLHICFLDGLFDTVDNGWRYDFALGGVPSLCLFVGFIFCPESPRYWLELPSKFCSENFCGIYSERFCYTAEKVLLSQDFLCLRIVHSGVWNRMQRKETELSEKMFFKSHPYVLFVLQKFRTSSKGFSLPNDSEQNSKCFSLLQNGLKRNSEQFLRKETKLWDEVLSGFLF